MSVQVVKLERPNPRQEEFLKCEKKYVAFGGARGGGKSWAVRTKAVLMALKYPGIRILLVRRTMPELESNHLRFLRRQLAGVAEYKAVSRQLVFPGGSVLELEGKKYLCFGGAESPDREEREPGVNWWKQEMPSDEEYAACEQNLEACGYQVDYVLTHDAPSRFLDFTVLASGETNQLHQFLDKILLKLTYEKWFFGCYHRDVQLSTKSRCVFCDVIPMGERRTGLFRR